VELLPRPDVGLEVGSQSDINIKPVATAPEASSQAQTEDELTQEELELRMKEVDEYHRKLEEDRKNRRLRVLDLLSECEGAPDSETTGVISRGEVPTKPFRAEEGILLLGPAALRRPINDTNSDIDPFFSSRESLGEGEASDEDHQRMSVDSLCNGVVEDDDRKAVTLLLGVEKELDLKLKELDLLKVEIARLQTQRDTLLHIVKRNTNPITQQT